MPSGEGHLVVINGQRVDLLEKLRSSTCAPLSVITEKRSAGDYSQSCVPIEVESFDDLGAVVRAGLSAIETHGPAAGVVALSERSLVPGAYLRAHLGLPGPGVDETLGFVSKHVMKSRLRDRGLPVCDWTLVPGPAALPATVASFGAPAVIKPVAGIGAWHTTVVESQEAWRLEGAAVMESLAGFTGPLLLERRADVVEEYHCDGLVVDGRVVFASCSRYFAPLLTMVDGLLGSYTVDAEDPLVRDIRELLQAAVEALGLRSGVTHLEVFRTDADQLVIGEIACRPGGGGVSAVLRAKYGVDIYEQFFRAARGVPLDGVSRPTPGVFGWCRLPVTPGRIRSISPVEDLAAVPGVTSAVVSLSPGDVVGAPIFSTSMAGMVHFRLEHPDEVEDLLSMVQNAFQISTTSD